MALDHQYYICLLLIEILKMFLFLPRGDHLMKIQTVVYREHLISWNVPYSKNKIIFQLTFQENTNCIRPPETFLEKFKDLSLLSCIRILCIAFSQNSENIQNNISKIKTWLYLFEWFVFWISTWVFLNGIIFSVMKVFSTVFIIIPFTRENKPSFLFVFVYA